VAADAADPVSVPGAAPLGAAVADVVGLEVASPESGAAVAGAVGLDSAPGAEPPEPDLPVELAPDPKEEEGGTAG
jgi:hypothetical protein